MRNKGIRSVFTIVLVLFLYTTNTFAQCAMCKTSVESNLASGGSIARGLNTGILYLMTIPYLVLLLGAYFFFKKTIDAKIKIWRNKHFPSKQAN